MWGLFVMAGTGLMLWAKVTVGTVLARWWLDVATAIHFYEAILATLAIVVWHFYQVFFDPDVYPMNWAWWDGKMSFEHYREEHGLDAETLLEAVRGKGKQKLSGPSPQTVQVPLPSLLQPKNQSTKLWVSRSDLAVITGSAMGRTGMRFSNSRDLKLDLEVHVSEERTVMLDK